MQLGTAKCAVVSRDLDTLRLRLTVLPIGETNPLNLVLVFNSRTGMMEVPGA